jgi:hypothetical protein
MDQHLRQQLNDLASTNDAVRLEAFMALMERTEAPVEWAGEAWDELVYKLEDANSYQRTIGALLLCNLTQSDSAGRMPGIVDTILAHTRDEKFITSRQVLQHCWKIARYNPALRDRVVDHLVERYRSCSGEKHYNLLRQDVIQALSSLQAVTGDENLLGCISALIAEDPEVKYQKAYRKVAAESSST